MQKAELAEILIGTNRQAHHNYFIIEKFEAGIVLKGTEVKSLREGNSNLKDSFALVTNGDIFLHNVHISPYKNGNRYNHEPLRTRKLLLHRKEIERLIGKTREKGLTLIPLKMYFNKKGIAKVEIGLCKGKKLFDKRETLKRRETDREIERAYKNR
ncbi:SsrA-binding protein SmpB [Candidatus Desantisbacteria bacterium]|nr:SsrA-binding protein SmpB [Candidatus Desantisbacteria bacterium]